MIDFVMSYLNPILWWPNHNKILNLPADFVLHITIGSALYMIMRAFKYSPRVAIITIASFAIFKELVFDLSATLHTHDYLEPFKDMVNSIIVPVLIGYYATLLSLGRALKKRVASLY